MSRRKSTQDSKPRIAAHHQSHGSNPLEQIGIWEWDLVSSSVYYSPAWKKLRGLEADAALPTPEQTCPWILPDDGAKRKQLLDRLRSGELQQFEFEQQVKRSDGSWCKIAEQVHAICGNDGHPVRLIGCEVDVTGQTLDRPHSAVGSGASVPQMTNSSDISRQEQTERALRRSERNYVSLAAVAPVGIFRMSDPTNCIYVNESWSKLTGYSREAALGRGWMDFVHPDDLETLLDKSAGFVNDAGTILQEATEVRQILPDGSIHWVQCHIAKELDEDGNVTGYVGTLTDIDRLKRTEEELKELNLRLHNVLKVSSIGIWEWSWEEQRLIWDEKMHEIYGVDLADFRGLNSDWSDRIHPDDLERLNAEDKIRLETNSYAKPFSREFRIVRPCGEVRYIYANVHSQFNENGDPVRTTGVNFDITDRKEVELANDVLARATKTKDEFLANMSHELRTPLTAILAMTDGLKQGMFGEHTSKQLECLKIVEKSGEHLLDLINKILDLAMIESGQTTLDFSCFAVASLCESCLNLVTRQAEQKQVKISFEAPKNLAQLVADEKRIRQVLINLLSNAVQFTPKGGEVSLRVETLPATTGLTHETLRFSVSDTGIGINPDQLKTLFEPFVQIDNSLTRAHGGTGLGLSLVKQFVDLHHGSTHVTSKQGKGSCFTVDIPFLKDHPDQAKLSDSERPNAPENSNSASTTDSATPLKSDADQQQLILLAEDNDDVAVSIIPILEFSNFAVLRAENGRLAIEMAQEHSPDLILMDIQMPEMDGLEATRQIRKTAKFLQLPIIAISGFAKPEDARRCIEAGANLFMAKPLRIKELLGSINSLLQEQTNANTSAPN